VGKLTRLALVTAACFMAIAVVSGAGAGMSRIVLVYDGTGSDIQPCNGEPVALTGQIMALFGSRVDAAGGVHINGNAVFQGMKGVGLVSGVTYVLPGSSPFSIETTNGATTTTTFGMRREIGPGQFVDFNLTVLEHTTIDANGEVRVDFAKETFECTQGP
jgi:hypothetical protein